MRYWRTIGLVIPCQVASPQSLTPFHQAGRSVTRDLAESLRTAIKKRPDQGERTVDRETVERLRSLGYVR